MEDNHNTRNYGICSPCHFLREAVSAILKCLGFDESKPCSENEDKDPASKSSRACPDPPSSTPQQDPNPTNDPPTEDLGRIGRRPTRPEISTGRDPQTNSIQPS